MCQVPQRQRGSCQDPSMHSQWRKGSQRECPYPVPTPAALPRPCPRPGACLRCILSWNWGRHAGKRIAESRQASSRL